MKNFNTSYIKKSANSFIKANKKNVRAAALLFLVISLIVEFAMKLLGFSGGLSLIGSIVSIIVLAPVQIGQLNMYYKMSKGENAELDTVLSFFKDGKKLADSLKTMLYYWGTLAVWFIIYVLCPMGIVYAIWGDSLAGGDSLINMAVIAVVFAGVLILAAYPYLLHMLKYSGGLFFAGQQSHLKTKMRFDIGKDFIKPHVYRYLILSVSYLPYWLISFAPIILAIFLSTYSSIIAYTLGIFGYAFYSLVFMPQFNMASMLMFERMQNPNEEMPYIIDGETVEFHVSTQQKEKKVIYHKKRKGSGKK